VHTDVLTESIESVQTNKNRICSKETNPIHEFDNVNKTLKNSLVIDKRNTSNSLKKHTLSKHNENCQDNLQKNNNVSTNNVEIYSKYNVLQKHAKQKMLHKKLEENTSNLEDSTDSEESIFEVPVPPKPKPMLINLQDSEEEDNTNLERNKDNSISENWKDKNASNNASSEVSLISQNSDIVKKSNKCKDTVSKNRKNCKSVPNKKIMDKTSLDKRLQILKERQQTGQDIILNCTAVQKGVQDINEIRQLSKNMEDKNQSNVGRNQNARGESQNISKNMSQDIPEASDRSINPQEETFTRSSTKFQEVREVQQNINMEQTIDYLEHVNQGTSDTRIESYSSNVTNQKRQYDNENRNKPELKRRCIVQQSDHNVIPQCSTNTNKEKRNELSGEHFFHPMPERLRNRYYSTRIQEIPSVAEMQRGMSKDPRMWAILDEDMIPIHKKRYIRCRNCNQTGHHRKDCPILFKTPCCHMCGMEGHTEHRCPQKCCLTCGKQQSTFRKTCEYCRVLYCTMCNSIGHKMQQCPDLWRRYHQTTSMDNVPPQNPGNLMKSGNMLHCCNCTKCGHESFTCPQYRWSQHFVTPAAVLNYVNGPMYTMNSSETNVETNVSTPKVGGDKTLISQSPKNIHQARREYVEPFSNTEASPSYVNKAPISQEAACIQETGYNLRSRTIDISYPEDNHNQTEKRLKEELDFVNVVYKCSKFNQDFNKNVKLIFQNLSEYQLIKNYFSKDRKKKVINNLVRQKIAPVFLEKLSKNVEFEIKIGFIRKHKDLMVQVIAIYTYASYIMELFLHWFRIPDEEKNYGVVGHLPRNSIKMHRILKAKEWKLNNFIHHECASDKAENDPQWLYQKIKQRKSKLESYVNPSKNDKVYNKLNEELQNLQLRLLMIVHTEFKNNNYIDSFQKEFNTIRKHTLENNPYLASALYVKITLLYNRLFVPHTSGYLYRTLKQYQKKSKKSNNSSRTQQKLEMLYEEENPASHTNENASSSATVYSMQDTVSTENSSTFTQQNADNDISNEKSYLPSGTNDMTDDEVILIEDTNIQSPQTTSTLVTEPMLKQSENMEKNEAQSSISDVNNEKQMKEKQKSKMHCREKKQSKKSKNERKKENLEKKDHVKALKYIQQARMFKLPYMINAAEKLQEKINNNIAKKKHVTTLMKLIALEKRHQNYVNNYCNYLQT